MIAALFRWYRRAATALVVLGCAGQLAIMILRNVANWEPDWLLELTTLTLVFGSLLFIADTTEHIAFRGLAAAAGPRWGPRVRTVASGLTMLATVVLFVVGVKAVIEEWQLGGTTPTDLHFPLWLLYAIVPVIALFATLRQWDAFRRGDDAAQTAPWSQ